MVIGSASIDGKDQTYISIDVEEEGQLDVCMGSRYSSDQDATN